MDVKNISALNDVYQLYMSNGYFKNDLYEKTVVFDLFFRDLPNKSGFAIMAGVEEMMNRISAFSFSNEDIEFIEKNFDFSEDFINYLRNFKFKGDVFSVPEGTPIFSNEPIVTVKASLPEAQMLEALILQSIYYPTLVATTANRMVRAAQGRGIIDFSTRRANSEESALIGSRAAYIGGCSMTSNLPAAKKYGIDCIGSMTHGYIMMFENELEAFKSYARENPDGCVLTVDTYNSLRSGIPNAIRAFNEELIPIGKRPKGILIGSGDITYISKKARTMLDEAGFPDCSIIAANALDEYIIRDMLIQGAEIDFFGVGDHLTSVSGGDVFPLVYKPVAVYNNDGKVKNLIKVSQNTNKITTPGFKALHRFFDKETGKALADLITFNDEEISDLQPFEIFDPDHLWKSKVLDNFVVRSLQRKIFENGKTVYKSPSLQKIRKYSNREISTLWEEVLRFEHPHKYYVDLSKRLWTEREKLLSQHTNYKGEIRK